MPIQAGQLTTLPPRCGGLPSVRLVLFQQLAPGETRAVRRHRDAVDEAPIVVKDADHTGMERHRHAGTSTAAGASRLTSRARTQRLVFLLPSLAVYEVHLSLPATRTVAPTLN